jgi:hypothetical protein
MCAELMRAVTVRPHCDVQQKGKVLPIEEVFDSLGEETPLGRLHDNLHASSPKNKFLLCDF